MMDLTDGEKSLTIIMFTRFDRTYERDRQTHRHRMTAKDALEP